MNRSFECRLPSGWSILFANDVEYASDEYLSALSENARILGLQVHEGVMYSRALEFRHGQRVWEVEHDSQSGLRHLETSGSLPDTFEAIHTECWRAQDAEADDAMVNHIIDIPAQLVMRPTGYRYDQAAFDWGQPIFYQAVQTAVAHPKWWQKLLRR